MEPGKQRERAVEQHDSTTDHSENSETESCTDRSSSQFENNYFTEMCSGSEAGAYLRLIDFVYHSTLGFRVIKKKKIPQDSGVVSARRQLTMENREQHTVVATFLCPGASSCGVRLPRKSR